MHRLPNVLTHGAPLRALRRRESSAIKTTSKQVWLWFTEQRGGDTQALPRIFRLCWIPNKSLSNQATQKIPEEKISIIPVTWDPQYAPFPPGRAFLKSRYCVGKNTLFNDLFVSILKVETEAGINLPGYVLSQIKGKYKNVTIPPNIATRANTRGLFLFQCCRVVLNKDKNRLELPKGEGVGKPVNRCKEDEEEEYKNTAVSLVGDMESSLIGKINIFFRLNYSGLLVTNPVPRVIPLFPRICMYLHYFTFLLK